MIEISKEKYNKVKHLLDYVAGDKVFAYSIIENNQSGTVYVNNEQDITSAVFWHNCGYSLLAEAEPNSDSIPFIISLFDKKHPLSAKAQVLQVDNEDLRNKIENEVENDKSIRKGIRQQFRFNRSRYKSELFPTPDGCRIVQIDNHLYPSIKGNVIPSFSWASEEEFLRNGAGFLLMKEDDFLSLGFSFFIGNGQLDIGVETPPRHRKNGYAKITASAVIKYCLENDLEPIWACVKENISTRKLALSLGFELVAENSYYYRLQR